MPPGIEPLVFEVLFPAVSPRVFWDEHLLDELVQLVRVDIREYWRYHPALRASAQRFAVLPVLQVPGLEHVNDQPQEPVIVNLLRQDPHHDIMVR